LLWPFLLVSCGARVEQPAPTDAAADLGYLDEPPSVCSSTASVASCPTDNACTAPVQQSGATLMHRISRLRLWAPEPLLALTPIAFDPNINPRCVNSGNESLNWLLLIQRSTNTLFTGPARPSADGRTFSFVRESYDGSSAAMLCPGFIGPSAPMLLGEAKVPLRSSGTGFSTDAAPRVVIAIYDGSGTPLAHAGRFADLRARRSALVATVSGETISISVSVAQALSS